MSTQATQEAARQWLAQDPDPVTRAELEALLDDESRSAELEERFGGMLEFGTAGLRGVLGAGPMRMNRVLVHRVSAGLASYLDDTIEGAKERGVVIGYDGRINSRIFAEDTARVLMGAGFKVYLSTDVVPTPVCAFAVLDTKAAAGVMVTASHNPPEYNGYKVYWENGAQIIPPHDKGIAAAIDAVGAVDELPVVELEQGYEAGRLVDIDDAMIDRYYDGVGALSVHPEVVKETELSVVYTPMHGVGSRFVEAVFERAGFQPLHIVEAQKEPDGNFPTVAFPNPEEDGAMDMSFELARKVGAELVIANDPDADRLAIAVPADNGDYTMLTGDQIGVLLADYLLSEGKKDDRRLVSTTIVSSQLLGIMAKDLGLDYKMCLTGFKWIANGAIDAREATGARFVMGYEEALGYSCGELVRDKDGVSAALLFAELAAVAKSRGESVLTRLEALYRKYGVFLTKQKSLVLPGSDGSQKIKEHMHRFRSEPPSELGGFAVRSSHDLNEGAFDLPKSNVLVYFLEGDRRIIMRPSGTEPKLKCYYEVCVPMGEGESMDEAMGRAREQVEALCSSHQAMLA